MIVDVLRWLTRYTCPSFNVQGRRAPCMEYDFRLQEMYGWQHYDARDETRGRAIDRAQPLLLARKQNSNSRRVKVFVAARRPSVRLTRRSRVELT